MQPTDLLTLASAVWYWSYVLTSSDGPLGVFQKAREWRKGAWHGRRSGSIELVRNETLEIASTKTISPVSGLLDCIICTAIWVGVVFTLAPHGWLTDASAVAGVALFLHSYTGWRSNY